MSTNKPEIFTEIPDNLQRLTRLVTRGFYGFEHGVIIDLLIKNICMREDDLRDLVKLDPKQLRQILLQLKAEKIVKERQQTETRPDNNRPLRHNYYFISYMGLINMLKYKLDHMRKKLESEEKDTTTRASYKCPSCSKSFSDLDVGFLWNGVDDMICTFCQSPVEEDTTAGPNTSTRSLLAKFNEQMLPFYELLRELDDIRLAPNLLEPALKRNGQTVAGGFDPTNRNSSTSSVPSLGGRSTTDLIGLNYNQNFSINIESQKPDGSDVSNSHLAPPKEVPVWMRTSTVGEVPMESSSTDFGIVLPKYSAGPAAGSSQVTDDLQSLLAAEKHLKSPPHSSAAKTKSEESSGDESDMEEVHTVEVGGKLIPLADVTPDLVAKMTGEEKAKYIELSQQMLALYD